MGISLKGFGERPAGRGFAGRLKLGKQNTGPTWVSPPTPDVESNIGSFDSDTFFTSTAQVQAINRGTYVTNFSVSGLPLYIDANGYIAGEVPGSGDPTTAPTWNGSSVLGEYDEGDTVDVTLSITPESGRTVSNVGTVSNGEILPWGIHINKVGADWKITGNVYELAGKTNEEAYTVPNPPVWNTDNTSAILNLEERETTTFALDASINPESSATTISYFLVDGFLPFGMYLGQDDGRIYGSNPDIQRWLYVPEDEINPKPTWNTSDATPIIVADENEIISFTLDATANKGTTIDYTIVDGFIPWGTNLNLNTGEIAGTVYPDAAVTDPEFELTPKPTWVSSGELGPQDESTAVNISLNVTSTNTINQYFIISGFLPFGASINATTGVISGTLSEVDTTTTYNFTVRATDTSGAFEDQALSLTVNNVA